MSLKALEILIAAHGAKGELSDGLALFRKLEAATRIRLKAPTDKDVKALPQDKELKALVQRLKLNEVQLKAVSKMALPPEAQPAQRQLVALDNGFQSAAGSTEIDDEQGCKQVASSYKALTATLDREIRRLTKHLDPFRLALRSLPPQRTFYGAQVKYARSAETAYVTLGKSFPQLGGTSGQAKFANAAGDAKKLVMALSVHASLYDRAIANVEKLDGAVRKHLAELRTWQDETKNHPKARELRNVAALRKMFQ